MSKRNFILLIIVLIIILIGFFTFVFFNNQNNTNNGGGDNTGTNFISQFNPFGNGKTNTPPKNTPPTDVSGYQPPAPVVTPKLIKISSMPIAGYTVYSKERLIDIPVVAPTDPSTSLEPSTTTPTTTSKTPKTKTTTKPTAPLTEFAPALRYVDRANGNIYETFADKVLEKKFSTTVIPQIYEAFFGNGGQSVVMRYLKGGGRTIETFVSSLPKEYLGADTSTPNEITGTFLPENIKDVSLSPDSGSMFYLFENGDNMIGTTINLTNNKRVQVFSSPFTEWLSWWPNSKEITLTTKPSSGIPGYMYSINPNTKGLLSQVFGKVNGLTTLTSPDGKMVLYSKDALSTSIYHTDTKTSDLLGIKTMPEKCVWGSNNDVVYCSVPRTIPSGQYPDSWYQGEVSFSDQIWKIDVKTGNTTLVIDPTTISRGEDIDGIKLSIDTGENYLFFVNKKNSYLWELSLK